MLFAPAVAAYVNAHFVPTVVDPPWMDGERRNPSLWERSERWKVSPRNAQLVWAVTPDEALRSGVYYQSYNSPRAVLQWLENIRVLDGAVEDPAPEAARAAVVQHYYECAQSLYRWHGEAEADGDFHRQKHEYSGWIASLPATCWCGAEDAPARLRTLRLDPPTERAASRAAIDAWFESWDRLDAADRPQAPWLPTLRKTLRGRQGLRADECAALLAVLRQLRS